MAELIDSQKVSFIDADQFSPHAILDPQQLRRRHAKTTNKAPEHLTTPRTTTPDGDIEN
ncbi:hypothetical protein NX722_17940 [Endozoicomonas gorgoniicola]|uniref:Uncharacterized protein n=1 Tax=Endozoicomonas gorgoniicola TaxID=1234144 RepID=A0ABT3MYM4_9GAMM|nr:hypothetical protein [Endozoicomonas gorgoniicola]MCW7554469.1 hypothetical protein [Endozoicomonas gorgoniicola]